PGGGNAAGDPHHAFAGPDRRGGAGGGARCRARRRRRHGAALAGRRRRAPVVGGVPARGTVADAADRGGAVRRGSRRWKIVLIVEDDSDGRALQALMLTRTPAMMVDWLPANGIGNIKRRAE